MFLTFFCTHAFVIKAQDKAIQFDYDCAWSYRNALSLHGNNQPRPQRLPLSHYKTPVETFIGYFKINRKNKSLNIIS